MGKKGFVEKICILLLFLGISFSICYWAMAKYDVDSDYTACGDAQYYIKMSNMDYKDVCKPYRYRVLMPSLVYVFNKYVNMDSFLSRYYEDVEKKKAQLGFGIINTIAIALSGFLLLYYCARLGFNKWESLVGALLFFTSFFVINYYPVPMVDSLAAFFIIAGFYAVLTNSAAGLILSFLFGVFTKETTFLIPLLIMLEEKKIFPKKLFYCLPGLITYIVFMNFFKYPQGWTISRVLLDHHYFLEHAGSFCKTLGAYFVIEGIQTFMFLWALFLYAIFKLNKPAFIERALWLLLLPFIFAPIGGTPVVGRVTFFLFPVIIPLSLLALRKLFAQDAVPS